MAAKILMTGSIQVKVFLELAILTLGAVREVTPQQQPAKLAEKFLFVVHSVKIPTVKHFLACLLTQELMYPILH